MPFNESEWSIWKRIINGIWTRIWGPHALQKTKKQESENPTLQASVTIAGVEWHAGGTVSNVQRNCRGEFIFAWHCDTLCLLACNLSFCSPPPPLTPPLPSRSRIHSTSLAAGPGRPGHAQRAWLISQAEPCPLTGEKSLSPCRSATADELVVLWLRRG